MSSFLCLQESPVSRCLVETPLPALEAKRAALWTEVQLLLNKGAIGEVDPGAWGVSILMTSIFRDLHSGMWMVSLDLKDAYLHVPIRPSPYKFLRFALKDQYGVLRGLPMVSFLATAPRLFTKWLTPVAAHLHFRTLSMYPYIDGIFHAQDSEEQVLVTSDVTIRLHLQLGFILNLAKCSLVPFQVMIHLGVGIYTLVGLVKPTPGKV